MEKLKRVIKNNILYISGAIAGGIVGYFYWKLVGCSSGSCVITSKPFNSIAYFAFMGSVLFGMFKRKEPSPKK